MLFISLKLMHIISATVLFGTGLGSAYYMLRAHLSQDKTVIKHVSTYVVTADWILTTTAVIVQFITGMAMVMFSGYHLTTPWIMWALILFVLVGVCWIPVVFIQIKCKQLVTDALAANQPLPALYYKLMRIWIMLGWPAFIGVLVIFYLMVFKPNF